MGMMDFLKKKDDTYKDNLGLDTSTTGFENSSFNNNHDMQNHSRYSEDFGSSSINSMNSNNSFGQSSQSMPQGDMQKDLQMISLKLDSIKSELDSMSQRLKNLENIAEKEQMPKNKKWY